MFFRFGAVVVLLIAVALAGVAIEKRNLQLRRSITLQEFRLRQLREQRARQRVRVERLRSPARLVNQATDPPPAAELR